VTDSAAAAATKELRLALVLYGGVSLAIYMHGITKELHKLVAASRALDVDDARNPFPAATTEHVYWETLKGLADEAGVRTQVVVDIVSGTSAGGINGVYLAKALAQNLRQDELRDLWIEKGDIAKLLRGHVPGHGKVQLGLALLAALRRGNRNEPVLKGDVQSVWYVEALEQMDGHPYVQGVDTLMPEGHDLELFVTTTDFYGYDREIPLADEVVTDRRHRHVFEFRRTDERNQFTPKYNYGLAFASRATSSFPGAFPAVSFADFERYFHPPISLGDFDREFCRIYELSGWSATYTYFMDGGVLDNYPFDHAIDAIRRRRADGEVERRLLYVQPDPSAPTPLQGQQKAPGWIRTFWGGLSAIPSHEPIFEQLLRIMERNERVAAIREIIESNFAWVRGRVEEPLHGRSLVDALPGADDALLLELRNAATAAANADLGHGYATYVRLKIRAVVDDFAGLVNAVLDYPDDSDHAFFVRAVVSEWAGDGGLFARAPGPTDAQLDFLRRFDLDYALRQLRFLIAAASWWYGDGDAADTPSREQLGAAKTLLWDRAEALERTTSGAGLPPALLERLGAVFNEQAIATAITEDELDPRPFLAARRAELDAVRAELGTFLDGAFGDFTPKLTHDLRELTADWQPGPRADFFVRYLGFAFWDVLLFPVQTLSDADERDEVQVLRVSPLESDLLKPLPGTPKLRGTAFRHFAAFFDKAFRENDYLWGRLDGAERLLGLLLPPAQVASRCAEAFDAILTEEGPDLPTTAPLVEYLRTQI
jgi:patatin-related protein